MSRGKEVKELREQMGMNRREFCDYFGIPYRTVQDWEAEKRELPDYLLRLLKYRAEIEKMMKNILKRYCELYRIIEDNSVLRNIAITLTIDFGMAVAIQEDDGTIRRKG